MAGDMALQALDPEPLQVKGVLEIMEPGFQIPKKVNINFLGFRVFILKIAGVDPSLSRRGEILSTLVS